MAADLSEPRPGGHHGRRGPFRRASVRGGARDRHRRHQASAGRGRGRHRERDGGEAPLGRPARPGARHDPAHPLRPRRRQGARAAVNAVFDHPVIARCQVHKIRNVESQAAQGRGRIVERRMRAAYRNPDALAGQGELEALARELDAHPGAAASLREGLAETLTISRLGVPPTLARTLRSTNAIESMIEICRDHSTNVKRWRDGQMALRWCAAGHARGEEAVPPRQRHLHLPALRTALDAHVAAGVTPRTTLRKRRWPHSRQAGAVTEIPHRSGHPRAPSRFPHPL